MTAGLARQTLASLPDVEQGWPIAWQALLVGVAVGNSVLFWLFARALFDDAFGVRPRHAVVWLGVTSIGAGFCIAMAALGPGAWPTLMLELVLRCVPAVFASMAVVTAASQWRADLVEPRRRLRAFIVVAGASYALAMVAVRLNSAHACRRHSSRRSTRWRCW